MFLSEKTKTIVCSDQMFQLVDEYEQMFGENPPSFNYHQYKDGEDMLKKITEALQTGKPIIPKKELSMFDI